MDFVKAKEVLSALQKLDPDSKETIIGALDIAEHVESASKEFYEKEAAKTRGTELEAFFVFLVKEETMHLNKILELKSMLKSGKVNKISFDHNAAPHIHEIPAGQQEMSAILYSLWREKKAVEFYAEAAEKTKGAVKKFFSELAEFERGHVALFEEYVELMQNAGELIMG